jgi:hypothetical protein
MGMSAKGKVVEMKLTFVLEYPSKPLLFSLHLAKRPEAKIFKKVTEIGKTGWFTKLSFEYL